METTPAVPDVQSDRAEALAADALEERDLPAAGERSLARAIERLPNAITLSNTEAQPKK